MPADLATLSALKARVEAATGPDRELDGALYAVQQGWDAAHWGSDGLQRLKLQSRDGDRYVYGFCGESADDHEVPYFTDSVDDALALAEQALPATKAYPPGAAASSGWKITLYRGMTPTDEPQACWEANIRPHGKDGHTADAPTAPLAVLAAVIAALAEDASHAR